MHIVFCTTIGLLALGLILAAIVGAVFGIVWLVMQSQTATKVAAKVGRGLNVAWNIGAVILLAGFIGFAIFSASHALGCRIIKLF